ncbi:hypothetical protein O6H91_03G056400 [Diphasiastrum complanatum]|uniref:Uncharacterized protein n=1 Tax=Diphasiastrum complanatum TaxID=34168 RepID=A0ACC2E6P6_DIPCM|nr:hypothetical protein O6H91_03G056400 [Diphasiastrum complanatum]
MVSPRKACRTASSMLSFVGCLAYVCCPVLAQLQWANAATSPGKFSSLLSSPEEAGDLAPVVLIPGVGGTQLHARLTNEYRSSSFLCWNWGYTDYFQLWLDMGGILPPFTQCFAGRMQLIYNPSTKRFRNAPGVNTEVSYFGSTRAMEYLDPKLKCATAYLASLVNNLKQNGYIDGKTLFGAPYDFRYAPGPNAADVAVDYLKNLKNLIETASSSNDDKPVVLVAHSLGALWTLYLLNQQPIEWRQKYVGRFIGISAPWGGSVLEMLIYASGYAEGVPIIDPLVLRAGQRSIESNLWLLPVKRVFNSSILVSTPSKEYTAFDLEDFFIDIGYPQAISQYATRVPYLIDQLQAPLVPVTLIFGQGVQTPQSLIYKHCGFNYRPDIVYGDGDGKVNLESLTAVISDWADVKGQALKVIRLLDQTHSTVVTSPDGVSVIVDEIMKECVPVNTSRSTLR